MSEPKLYIFNPDTDYALASGSDFYTPSKLVGEMTRRMTLYPALWADVGGVILSEVPVEDALREAHPTILRAIKDRHLEVTDFRKAGCLLRGTAPVIRPWGWNPVLRRRLERIGVDLSNSPSEDWERRLELSSREETIALNKLLSERLPEFRIPIPIKLTAPEEAVEFRKEKGEAVLKDPWSSSGRGVLVTTGMTETRIREWVTGVIRKHGFVMAETLADRKADCATLWEISGDEASFIGFSMFTTTERGKYLGQIVPDSRGREYIFRELPFLREAKRIVEVQKEFLKSRAVTHAEASGLEQKGYAERADAPEFASIDMLVERDGNVRPGIEINRRMTMGVAAYLIAQKIPEAWELPEPFLRIEAQAPRTGDKA